MSAATPRKLPRQRRSKATVEAILDACAEVISAKGFARATTAAVAQRAGVSIGTLYQYFPNRDAVGGALVVRACRRLLDAMRVALTEAAAGRLDPLAATEHLLLRGLDVLVDERSVFAELGREAPQLFRLPEVVELQRRLIALAQEIRLSSGAPLDLPLPEADSWIIGHMVSASMLQISLLDAPAAERRLLTREVARLTCRMALEPAGASAAGSARPEPAGADRPDGRGALTTWTTQN
jgi:AcrR family transcriptional regulator